MSKGYQYNQFNLHFGRLLMKLIFKILSEFFYLQSQLNVFWLELSLSKAQYVVLCCLLVCS